MKINWLICFSWLYYLPLRLLMSPLQTTIVLTKLTLHLAGRKLAKEIGCKFIETSSGLNHKVDELLVGIVAQVKLNPQRIRNLSEKQRNSLCMAMHNPKIKGTNEQDHFSQLRRKERNKSNNGKGNMGISKHDHADESDDERSSDDGSSSEQSDIEKYFNLEVNAAGEGSKITRLLKSRRHATPGRLN